MCIRSIKDVVIILLKIKMNNYLNRGGKVKQSSLPISFMTLFYSITVAHTASVLFKFLQLHLHNVETTENF